MSMTRFGCLRATFVLFLAPVLLAARPAAADVITPVTATPTTEFAAAVNLINGSGLDGVGPVQNQLHDNNENNMWQTFAGTSVGESVTFELDKNYDLSDAVIWQYNGPDGNGNLRPDREVEDLEVLVSSDLVSPLVSIGTITLAAAQDQSVAGFNEPAQTFALTGADDVRRVQFVIQSVQGGVSDGFAGLSEVRFLGIPEPATCGLLAMGAGGLALLARRRRHSD